MGLITDQAVSSVKDREPKTSLALYHLFKWSLVSPLLHVCFQIKIYGGENVPQTGGLIVVSNHASDFDPPILSNCIGRPVAFMAKEELFRIPLLKTIIKMYGAYPVRRGAGDRAAIRSALGCIENGWATGVFLQGTRTLDGRITEPKLGATLIAAKSGAPLLPVSIWGTNEILPKGAKLPRLHPVTVRIGKPIIPSSVKGDRSDLQALTEQCAEVINNLHAQGR